MWAKGKQPVQRDSEEFRLEMVEGEEGAVDSDCGLPQCLEFLTNSHLPGLRTIFLEGVNFMTAVITRCSPICTISLLW